MKGRMIAIVLMMLGAMSMSVAQDYSSGTLKMKVTDFSMGSMPGMEGAEGMEEMMKGMMESIEMTMIYKPDMMVSKTNMMMMQMEQHMENGKMTQYMDVMGQKIKMVIDTNDPESYGISKEQYDKIMSLYKNVVFDKSARKTIAGFDCYKASMKMDMSMFNPDQEKIEEVMPGMGEVEMIFYITEKIPVSNYYMQNIPVQLPGMPLEMDMNMGPMKMTFTTTEYSAEVDPKAFKAPEGDYQEMTMEEMKKLGMGG